MQIFIYVFRIFEFKMKRSLGETKTIDIKIQKGHKQKMHLPLILQIHLYNIYTTEQ